MRQAHEHRRGAFTSGGSFTKATLPAKLAHLENFHGLTGAYTWREAADVHRCEHEVAKELARVLGVRDVCREVMGR